MRITALSLVSMLGISSPFQLPQVSDVEAAFQLICTGLLLSNGVAE